MRVLVLMSFLTISLSCFAGTEFEAPEISPTCAIELAKFEEENREHVQDFIARVTIDHVMQMLSIRRVAISDGALNVQQVVDLRLYEMLSFMMNKKSLSARETEYLKSLRGHLLTYPLDVEEIQIREINERFLALGL